MKRKGTYVERKISEMLKQKDWIVIRSTGSFGKADLVCIREGEAMFIECKSTSSSKIYYNSYMGENLAGFPFFVVADFGYGKVRILKPKKVITPEDGVDFKIFLQKGL